MEHKLLGWEYCYTTHVKLIHNLSAINTLFAHLVTSQGNQVNTMAADALAPWVARSSATLILSTQGNRVPVTSKEGFYLSVQSQHCHWEMIENEFFFFPKKNSAYTCYQWYSHHEKYALWSILYEKDTSHLFLNISRLVLQLSLPIPLKPGVKTRMKM